MQKLLSLFIFSNLIVGLYFLYIKKIAGTSLKDCQIKIQNKDWFNIDNCDNTTIDEWWSGGTYVTNLSIDYNLGDRINIWIKVFNNLPYHNSLIKSDNYQNYEDFCSIYITIWINEFQIVNEKDYIYYCYDCDCTSSLGEKTFCHKWGDKRLYCNPKRGKVYNFFIMINGYNELNLMNAYLNVSNYYRLIKNDYYLSENEERVYIKFSSDSVLVVNSNKSIKVNLDELSIKYSYKGNGDFYTIDG